MKVEKTVKITLTDEEKKICHQFNEIINAMCSHLNGECELCPLKNMTKGCECIGSFIGTVTKN